MKEKTVINGIDARRSALNESHLIISNENDSDPCF